MVRFWGIQTGVQTESSRSQKLRQRHSKGKTNVITRVSRLRFYRVEIVMYSNGSFKRGVKAGGSMSQKLRERHSSIIREMSSLESVG